MRKFWVLGTFAMTAALLGATPAAAKLYKFTLLTAYSSTGGSDNALKFRDTYDTVNARVTAWSTNSGTTTRAFLGDYAAGLGVTNDSENGSNNTHTIDDQNGDDFIVFQFDRMVTVDTGTFTGFTIGGDLDTDAIIGIGTTNQPWTSDVNFATSANQALFTHVFPVLNGGTDTDINPNSYTGNLLFVKASNPSSASPLDAFKFMNLVVEAAVPEPAGWATMIVGLGLVGAGMKRRRRIAAAA